MSKVQFMFVLLVFSAVAAAVGSLLGQQMRGLETPPISPRVVPQAVLPSGMDCTACRSLPSYYPIVDAIPTRLPPECRFCYVEDMNAAGVFPYRVKYGRSSIGCNGGCNFWGYHVNGFYYEFNYIDR